MKTSDFYYDLPQKLIAQRPTQTRDGSRLLILNKKTGEIKDTLFPQMIDYLNAGDCLVVNRTKVIPARLIGNRMTKQGEEKGGVMELLLLRNLGDDCWETLAKPGRRAKKGVKFEFTELLRAEIMDVTQNGGRIVKFSYDGIWENVLDEVGQVPLPPYITEQLIDKQRYQTVYSKEAGSAAAPTAGLHFTPELIEKIKDKGVWVEEILLHVGLGTFRPVKCDNVEEHKMHSEYYCVSQENADHINAAKAKGGKLVCVGTTSCRAIESACGEDGIVAASEGFTDIFIKPPYQFKAVDKLLTNFHLPESTLLMLISALATKAHIFKAYEHAIKEKYRFFSFGDAMFIS